MHRKNSSRTIALLLVGLMIMTPLAAGIVSTFSNGNSESVVELRDGSIFFNEVDASIDLPDGQTVTSASMSISTEPTLHGAHTRIDLETMPRVWNPAANNQLTSFTNPSAFEYESESAEALPVRLKTDGFVSDFEGTTSDFTDQSPPPFIGTGWNHGSLPVGSTHPASCASGTDCWGTGMSDTNYTDDNTGGDFKVTLESHQDGFFVANSLKNYNLTFESWFNFRTIEGSQPNTKQYPDCGYIQIRSQPNPGFPVGDPQGDYDYHPFSMGAGSGSDFNMGDGLYQRTNFGQSNNQIHSSCGGIPQGTGNSLNYGIGGSSTTNNRQSGWGTLAIDLSDYLDQYVQIRFVMEHNPYAGSTSDWNLSGWYIDDIRLGDKLAQEESMTVRGITPSVFGGDNHPNGYGLLSLEAEMSRQGSLTVDVMDLNGNVVVGRDGSLMENLEGEIIELWNINSTTDPTVNLNFVFNSGSSRLSSAVLHGFSLGTRVGTGFNITGLGGPMDVSNGVWNSVGGQMPMMYTPSILDDAFSPALKRSTFTHPIGTITPYIQDDCTESPTIEISSPGINGTENLTDGVKFTLDNPIFGFSASVSYANACGVGGMWFDLEFAHHPSNLKIDVAEDGDFDWGFTEPAFGEFGHQNMFQTSKVDGINYGSPSTTLTLNQNGEAEGAYFMLPKGAVVNYAEVSFDQNSILSSTNLNEAFELELLSGTQSESLGTLINLTIITPDYLSEPIPLADAINALLTNPLTPISHYDEFGVEWMTFRFKASSDSAPSGSTATATGLEILYDYAVTFDSNYGFDTELNQGVALWTGGSTATVPIGVYSTSGGGMKFSSLSVSTSSGFTNTFIDTGNPVGLYPNGDIYEFTTEHTVADITGTSLSEAWLSFESPSGHALLTYSDFASFNEVNLPGQGDLITLESSSVSDITDGKQITWRFRVNTGWEDASEVRVYAGLTAVNGVNGLPDAILFAPQTGNAVENDAGITSFQLQNTVGIAQDLDSAESGQTINLVGSVRLEDLDVAPDPAGYNLVLELKHVNITGEEITIEWEEVENYSGVIGGDFDLEVDLGSAVGEETYRFGMRGYEGGTSLCPSTTFRPDETCSIPFNITIDTYEPNLLSIQVLDFGSDRNLDDSWRTLYDDTWVVPSATQSIRMTAQDIPAPPATLDMMYWVENDHDADGDREADEDEYIVLTLYSDGNAPNATYYGNYSDNANLGLDPEGLVSVYIVGYDLAGNAINGGGPGFDNDKVTYVSMQSENPVIRNFFIENSAGERLINSNSGSQYVGEWNMTMYAGNTYHLIVEGNDDNGWRDVDYIQIDLDDTRDDMTVKYFPRNETAWTDSPHLSIVEEGDGSDGPELRKMDGSALVNPFISDFYLDLPIQINWGVLGESGSVANTPVLYMKDMDNPEYRMLPAPGRYIQSWYYGSDIRLDVRDDFTNNLMISPYFQDGSAPFTQDVREGFVYKGDTIWFTGQYVFKEGYPSVFINPETELTMKITRLAAQSGGVNDYSEFTAGGADSTVDFGQPTYHNFSGGQFNISIRVPSETNEYTYQFELVDLPEGAIDLTPGFCETSNTFGCGSFKLKVDSRSPSVTSLSIKKGIDNTPIDSQISTANYHCLDISSLIIEREGFLAGGIKVGWKFYTDADNGIVWPTYQTHFGTSEPQTQVLDLVPSGTGVYSASTTCLDLWPLDDGEFDPEASTINGVEVAIWIEGTDSSGSAVILGGGPNMDGTVAPTVGSNLNSGIFSFIYEEAKFSIRNVRLTPSSPEVGDKAKLEIEVVNTGTMVGSVTLEIRSVLDENSIPSREGNVSTSELQIGASEWVEINLEAFGQTTTGMYYIIYNEATNEPIWNGNTEGEFFNVKVASEDGTSGGLIAIISIMGVILAVLGTLVVVLLRRTNDGDNLLDDDDDDDEYYVDDDAKSLVDIPAQRTSADPEMQRALDMFPQWSESDIQGYFDQGWSVDQLQDWVNSNQ